MHHFQGSKEHGPPPPGGLIGSNRLISAKKPSLRRYGASRETNICRRELLVELLDKSIVLEPLMDLEEIDSQANTYDRKTVGEIF